jgi:hypothetical protein
MAEKKKTDDPIASGAPVASQLAAEKQGGADWPEPGQEGFVHPDGTPQSVRSSSPTTSRPPPTGPLPARSSTAPRWASPARTRAPRRRRRSTGPRRRRRRRRARRRREGRQELMTEADRGADVTEQEKPHEGDPEQVPPRVAAANRPSASSVRS